MHIYFAGIGGVALGPLALIARQVGHDVAGSDLEASPITDELVKKGIAVDIGQDGSEIAARHAAKPVDWIVVSSAIAADHPTMTFAKAHGIKVTKRHELINKIICCDKKQKMVAVAGTHGKTSTTAMLIWLFKQFDVPASYSAGALLGFAANGHYAESAEYFVYEADEYDRNMLHFEPTHSIITSVDYDHPDTYPTVEGYKQAFRDFVAKSENTYLWQRDSDYLGLETSKRVVVFDDLLPQIDSITLPGQHTRRNGLLAAGCFNTLFPEFGLEQIIVALNRFPGVWRRFEKLADNLYTTYAHHPAEIAANVQTALELDKNVVVVYQPHQNLRQHSMADEYKDCFSDAKHVYWLPTYLSREDPSQHVMTPQELIAKLDTPGIAEPASMDETLVDNIKKALFKGDLVICMGAGDVDSWLRQNLSDITDTA